MRVVALFLAFATLVWAAAVVGFISLSVSTWETVSSGRCFETIQAASPHGAENDASAVTDE
jgi:hypothetical protein